MMETNPFAEDIESRPDFYLELIETKSKFTIQKFSPKHLSILDDVTQRIFEKVYAARYRYDMAKESKNGFTGWVSTIVHNEVITALKKEYDYNRLTDPYIFIAEDGNEAEHIQITEFSTKLFQNNGAEQEQTLIINEIISHLVENINNLDLEVLTCILNPPKKLRKLAKKRNGDGTQTILDNHIIEHLGITAQRLISCKTKFHNLIHAWIKQA